MTAVLLPTPVGVFHACGSSGAEACDRLLASKVSLERNRARMSRSAMLSVVTLGRFLARSESSGFCAVAAQTGLYMGVGASGARPAELEAMLGACIEDGAFSLHAFGEEGLRACNPLFAFQLMNGFTLSHASIHHGICGPSLTLFSRGAGTYAALREAGFAVLERTAEHSLIGAADSALHPVTQQELRRLARSGALEPSEGVAFLGLRAERQGCPVELLAASRVSDDSVGAAIDAIRTLGPISSVLFSASSDRICLPAMLGDYLVGTPMTDLGPDFGEALAATPALLWLQAWRRVAGTTDLALVVSTGLDDQIGIAAFRGRP